jgi:hypothetical protein
MPKPLTAAIPLLITISFIFILYRKQLCLFLGNPTAEKSANSPAKTLSKIRACQN